MSESTSSSQQESKVHAAIPVLLLAEAILLVLVLAWAGRVILLLLFAAIIFAIMLSAAAEWVMRMLKLGRKMAFALIAIVAVTAIGLIVWLVGPNIMDQFVSLQVELPRAMAQMIERVRAHGWGQWVLLQWTDYAQLSSSISYAVAQIGGFFVSTASLVVGIIIILFLGVYLAAEPEVYFTGLSRMVPPRYRLVLAACASKASEMIRSWLFAQMLSMVAIGLLVTVGLWVIGVPLAVSLGIIAALMTFIPNLGPILSVVPAALLALAISPQKGVLTLLLFMAVHFLEGNIITPLLQRRIVSLPPALTLVAQLLLALFAGPLGFALAAPITAATLGAFEVLLPPQTDVAGAHKG